MYFYQSIFHLVTGNNIVGHRLLDGEWCWSYLEKRQSSKADTWYMYLGQGLGFSISSQISFLSTGADIKWNDADVKRNSKIPEVISYNKLL